ncbi:MAG: Ig-like domain-containing protein, partial [Gammaproteobacteria bacterium]
SGNATVTILSSNAGPATITATTTASGPTASIQAEFVAVTPDQLSVQADKTTIGPNGEQATLTAIVRDPNNNLVKNVRVNFSIYDDVSNGSITTPTDTTDSQGRANTIYTSTSATTSKDGVVIIAAVEGQVCATPTDANANALCDVMYLTVAQNELFIVLGTANKIGGTELLYQYPYTVLVTDSGGNAVANTDVVLTLEPELYDTGWLVWNDVVSTWFQNVVSTCPNEDINRDGVLDTGEDTNSNTILDPRNVATVPVSVTTDDSGFAQFTIDYAKQFALWVNVTLTATAGVSGTESSSIVNFWLPASVDDMTDEANPPSYRSAFGATSACDEIRETIPYNVSATADTAVVVYWRPVDQASNYNVYRFPGGSGSCGGSLTVADLGGASKIASNLTTEFYVDSTVTSTSSYCYAVTAN